MSPTTPSITADAPVTTMTAEELLRHLLSLSEADRQLPIRFVDEWNFGWDVELVLPLPGKPLTLRATKLKTP